MSYNEDNFPDIPVSWTALPVEYACTTVPVTDKIQQKNYQTKGLLPILDQGASLIGGFTDDVAKIVTNELPVIIFGDHTRILKYADFKFAAGADGIKVLAPLDCFFPKLFFRFLQAIKLPDKGYARHFQYLRASRIALPPFNEQKRIADKLDNLLTRVDACWEHLDRVPLILKRFRQSVLSAATSGQLTEGWRIQNGYEAGISSSWDEAVLQDICQRGRVITYGVIKLGDEVPDGVPCLRTSNVRWIKIDTAGMKRIAASLSAEYSRTILKGTEVLVNVRGTLGGVAAVTPGMAGWNVSREVAVVPVDTTKANPMFLTYWIGSDASQRWLRGVEKGVAYIGINIEDLRTLHVELPPMDEQTEIVRRVQGLFAFADRLEAKLATAQNQAERLAPSLLAKAFRGELVPQDPNDEPASVLLERIRAERNKDIRASAKLTLPKLRVHGKATQTTEVTMLELSQIQPNHLTAILKEKGRLTSKALYQTAQLHIEDFYEQLRSEEAKGFLREVKEGNESYLEAT